MSQRNSVNPTKTTNHFRNLNQQSCQSSNYDCTTNNNSTNQFNSVNDTSGPAVPLRSEDCINRSGKFNLPPQVFKLPESHSAYNELIDLIYELLIHSNDTLLQSSSDEPDIVIPITFNDRDIKRLQNLLPEIIHNDYHNNGIANKTIVNDRYEAIIQHHIYRYKKQNNMYKRTNIQQKKPDNNNGQNGGTIVPQQPKLDNNVSNSISNTVKDRRFLVTHYSKDTNNGSLESDSNNNIYHSQSQPVDSRGSQIGGLYSPPSVIYKTNTTGNNTNYSSVLDQTLVKDTQQNLLNNSKNDNNFKLPQPVAASDSHGSQIGGNYSQPGVIYKTNIISNNIHYSNILQLALNIFIPLYNRYLLFEPP